MPDLQGLLRDARAQEALAADVVVVNHHLFFADVALRDEGISELLPACNTVIFDEAHQLPETARLFFGETVSTAQLVELARDARLEAARRGRRLAGTATASRRSSTSAARDLRLCCPQEGRPARRDRRAARRGRIRATRSKLLVHGARSAAHAALAEQSERSRRPGRLRAPRRRSGGAARARTAGEEGTKNEVRWVEVFGQSLQLHVTPLVPSPSCSASRWRTIRAPGSSPPRRWRWARTSRTSSGAGHRGRAAARAWPSPFDFARQALLYFAAGTAGRPNDPGYTDAVVEAALPVLEASRGRAFLLFTSHRGAAPRATNCCATALAYPLLVQGTGSRSELLVRFRHAGQRGAAGRARRSGRAWTCAARRCRWC